MHREIQMKQFPIVTTHWWPKTRNERFVWENEQYYIVFYLLYTTMSKWSECAHASGVWRVCARALAHAAFTRGVGVNAWRRACLKRGADATFQAPTEASANQIASCKYPIPVHATPEKYVIGCCNYDGVSAPRFRHALRQVLTPTSQSVRTHTSHTGCVCALRSLGHGCVQEVKNDINTVRFLTQTARFVS